MPLPFFYMKGVTLLAFGKVGYGKAAYNLAVTCKKYSPDIPIQLICEPGALSHLYPEMHNIFDEITHLQSEDFMEGKEVMPAKAKVNLYKYLIYDNTIFLDVDSVTIKDFAELFERDYTVAMEVKGVEKANVEKHKTFHWMHPKHLREHYAFDDEDIYGVSSAIMLIRKGDEAKTFFDEAIKAYDIRPPKSRLKEQWGASYPDELFFSVAFAKTKINPTLGALMYTDRKKPESLNGYYFLSFLGGKPHRSLIKRYDLEVGVACRQKGLRNAFPADKILKDKWLN